MNTLVKTFLKGLAVVLPIGLSLYIVHWLGAGTEALLGPPLEELLGTEGPLQYRTGMGVAAGVLIVFAVGLLSHGALFRRILGLVALARGCQ